MIKYMQYIELHNESHDIAYVCSHAHVQYIRHSEVRGFPKNSAPDHAILTDNVWRSNE